MTKVVRLVPEGDDLERDFADAVEEIRRIIENGGLSGFAIVVSIKGDGSYVKCSFSDRLNFIGALHMMMANASRFDDEE